MTCMHCGAEGANEIQYMIPGVLGIIEMDDPNSKNYCQNNVAFKTTVCESCSAMIQQEFKDIIEKYSHKRARD